jgi:predicted Zn-dependent protease
MHASVGILLGALLLHASGGVLAASKAVEQHETLEKEGGLYPDEKLLAYVRAVGKRVADASDRPDPGYTFWIVDDPAVNAFFTGEDADGRGYIYVTRGLLGYLETEDQLAAVLGHEIGHSTGNHLRRQGGRSSLGNVAAQVAGILTGNYYVMDMMRTYAAEQIAGYGRDLELEADQSGAKFLARAGYDPLAMIEVIQVLKDQELFAKKVKKQATTYHAVFASHPKSDRRLQQAVAGAQSDLRELAEPVGDFLAQLDGLTFGDATDSGAVRDQTYYHGRLGFVVEYPAGWSVYDSPSKIIGYPPGGATVAYISLEFADAEPSWTPREYIEKKLKADELVNGEAFEVEDMDGFRASLGAPTEKSSASEIAVIYKNERAFILRGETRDPAMVEALRAAFVHVTSHFRRMQHEDRRTAITERLAVVEAKPGDTYAKLARQTPLRANAVEQLRLLNGDYPVAEPRAGDRIKIVR